VETHPQPWRFIEASSSPFKTGLELIDVPLKGCFWSKRIIE